MYGLIRIIIRSFVHVEWVIIAPHTVSITLVDKKSTDKSMHGQKNTDKNVHARGPSVQILSVQFFSVGSNNYHGLQN